MLLAQPQQFAIELAFVDELIQVGMRADNDADPDRELFVAVVGAEGSGTQHASQLFLQRNGEGFDIFEEQCAA